MKKKLDRVKVEISVADFLFARDEMCRSFDKAADATRRLSDAFTHLSTEMLMAGAADPFHDDGEPDPERMKAFAAIDQAKEDLAVVLNSARR
jgi:hypothetical protein